MLKSSKLPESALAALMFLAFAVAYFISAALRTVTATLAPTLTTEFSLQARDLGLLSGGYFLGFAMLQIPLGVWLDKYGPRRVILGMLTIAVAGCAVFALSSSFTGLLLARVLCGLGVSVCLMAPLTAYRRWWRLEMQLRANSWMLMTGSLGMLCATLPVQAVMPVLGWRGIFWALGVLVVLSMVLIFVFAPPWSKVQSDKDVHPSKNAQASDISVWRHPAFVRMVPIGFFLYGGMIAIQTLWVGPWMTRVAGYTQQEAAFGLFAINFAMLVNYWIWGWINPKLATSGWDAVRLIRVGLPTTLLALPLAVFTATDTEVWGGFSVAIWVLWILYFLSSAFVSLAQPAVGMAFESHMAGRALTAYNLVIFMGVFTMQWGIGLAIDFFLWQGLETQQAFQAAFAVFWMTCTASYFHFYRLSKQSVEA